MAMKADLTLETHPTDHRDIVEVWVGVLRLPTTMDFIADHSDGFHGFFQYSEQNAYTTFGIFNNHTSASKHIKR